MVMLERGVIKLIPLSRTDNLIPPMGPIRQMLINYISKKYNPKADEVISTASYHLISNSRMVILRIAGESNYHCFSINYGGLKELETIPQYSIESDT